MARFEAHVGCIPALRLVSMRSSVPWSKSNMANQDGLDATQMMNSRISLVASGDRILKSIVTHMSIVKRNIYNMYIYIHIKKNNIYIYTHKKKIIYIYIIIHEGCSKFFHLENVIFAKKNSFAELSRTPCFSFAVHVGEDL